MPLSRMQRARIETAGWLAELAVGMPRPLRTRLLRLVGRINVPLPRTMPPHLVPPDYAARWLWEDPEEFRKTVRRSPRRPPST